MYELGVCCDIGSFITKKASTLRDSVWLQAEDYVGLSPRGNKAVQISFAVFSGMFMTNIFTL